MSNLFFSYTKWRSCLFRAFYTYVLCSMLYLCISCFWIYILDIWIDTEITFWILPKLEKCEFLLLFCHCDSISTCRSSITTWCLRSNKETNSGVPYIVTSCFFYYFTFMLLIIIYHLYTEKHIETFYTIRPPVLAQIFSCHTSFWRKSIVAPWAEIRTHLYG